MKTAKEILIEEGSKDPNFGLLSGTMHVIISAMEKYAKQEMFQFAKFADDNHFRRNKPSNMWFDNNFTFLTEKQFYELYKNKKHNRKWKK